MSNADTKEQVFDFEGNFESAFQAAAEVAGITAFAQNSGENLPPSFVGFQLQNINAESEMRTGPDGENYYFAYTATMQCMVMTHDEADYGTQEDTKIRGRHRSVVAKVRRVFDSRLRYVSGADLPYYSVTSFKPQGSTQTTDEQQTKLIQTLEWSLSFMIRTGAWPAQA